MTGGAADTIAAIATAVGGAIGIVRLSGPASETIAAGVIRPWPQTVESHRLFFARVVDEQGAPIDEVMVVVMRAPRSFTGELCVEISAHGGGLVLQAILDRLVGRGARLAQPGEFTRRAFVAGRIDLTRAEAIAQLIGAESEATLRAAQAMQSGALARAVIAARQEIVNTLADLEGALDFPDEDLQPPSRAELAARLGRVAETLAPLADGYRKHVWGNAEVVIVGRSNAGKSSLFNLLCGEERALVDAEPGTTRDLIASPLRVEEWSIILTDSAGWREEPGRLEQRGIALSRERLGRADVALLVVDGTVGASALEADLWAELPRRRIVVWNKADVAPLDRSKLPGAATRGATDEADDNATVVVVTSAVRGEGGDALKRAIAMQLRDGVPSGALGVSERQAEALQLATQKIAEAAREVADGLEEAAAVAARRALAALGRVTGETADNEILDAIFARFCIGK